MRRLGRTFRKGAVVGVVIGLAYALVRWLRAAPPGVTPLDGRPAPATSPEPTEAAWAAAPVVPEPVPPTAAVDDARSSPLATVLDEMAAEAQVADDAAEATDDEPPVPPASPAAQKRPTALKKAAAKKAAAKKSAAKKSAAKKVPTRTAAAAKRAARVAPTWVDPDGRTCPPSHPVKVRTASGIFHVPGGLAYGRTTPDRCYAEAAEAEADGYRAAKR